MPINILKSESIVQLFETLFPIGNKTFSTPICLDKPFLRYILNMELYSQKKDISP